VDDAALEAALLSDSFASFEAVVIEAKQAEDVEDKMVRKGRAK
jgi:negative regulator of sigma E activity